MLKCSFFVDGFNLYHSLVDAQVVLAGKTTKWLDLPKLCKAYLPQIRRHLDEDTDLGSIYFFSAPPKQSDVGKQKRHELYMQCLSALGVIVLDGRFKPKDVTCKLCRRTYVKYEEKETDVAIAVEVLRQMHYSSMDVMVLFSGDSDLVPLLKACKEMYPNIPSFSIFPFKRKSKDLDKHVRASFKIKAKTYSTHQLPDPVDLPGSRSIPKPDSW